MIETLLSVIAIVVLIVAAWQILRARAAQSRADRADGLDPEVEAKLTADRIAERLRTLGARPVSGDVSSARPAEPAPLELPVARQKPSVDARQRLLRDSGYVLVGFAALLLLASVVPFVGDPTARPSATHLGVDQAGATPASDSAVSTAFPEQSAGGSVAGETFVPIPSATPPAVVTPAGATTPRPTPRRTPRPTAIPSSAPTAGATPSGGPTPTPALTPSPTPTPLATPTPAPTPEPTPDPTPEPTPTPSP